MARVESMVENLSSSQRGVFDRMNRPWQWGVVVAAVLGMVTLYQMGVQHTAMALAPIHLSVTNLQNEMAAVIGSRYTDELQRKEVHDDIYAHLANIRVEDESQKQDIAWLKELEKRRYTERLNGKRPAGSE
jgi:predicted transposase YbfD/YdcC